MGPQAWKVFCEYTEHASELKAFINKKRILAICVRPLCIYGLGYFF
jgi:hypothetical protein